MLLLQKIENGLNYNEKTSTLTINLTKVVKASIPPIKKQLNADLLAKGIEVKLEYDSTNGPKYKLTFLPPLQADHISIDIDDKHECFIKELDLSAIEPATEGARQSINFKNKVNTNTFLHLIVPEGISLDLNDQPIRCISVKPDKSKNKALHTQIRLSDKSHPGEYPEIRTVNIAGQLSVFDNTGKDMMEKIIVDAIFQGHHQMGLDVNGQNECLKSWGGRAHPLLKKLKGYDIQAVPERAKQIFGYLDRFYADRFSSRRNALIALMWSPYAKDREFALELAANWCFNEDDIAQLLQTQTGIVKSQEVVLEHLKNLPVR
ncbi:MAG: hypothetical protein FWD15_01900 [Alphaproteobacteria bacterium]|nr:hypothetical protein [Alphaproteobacteria bacterium]